MPAETKTATSSTALTRAQPLLTYALVLPHVLLDGTAQQRRSDADDSVVGHLYFTTPEAQKQQRQHQDPRAVVEAVRDGIEAAEQRQCALHRVQVAPQPSSSATANTPQTVLYAERVGVSDGDDTGVGEDVCEAVLTACPELYEREMSAEQSYEAATVAPLCVFQDVCGGEATRDIFWRFLTSVLRLGIRAGTNAAAVAGVRGRVVSAVEDAGGRGFCVDVFSDDTEMEAALAGSSAALVMAVDSVASIDHVVQRLQDAFSRAEQRHGSALLVVEITWRRFKDLRQPAAPPPVHSDKRSCLLWLPNAPSSGDEDAVYAEAALEMLLDELVLAAATTSAADAESGVGVFSEPGVQQMIESCQLTRAVADQLRHSFSQRCRLGGPLFHWVVCAPPSRTGRLDSRVTRRTFASSAGACMEDYWATVELLEHWKDVAVVTAALALSVSPVVPPAVSGRTAERPVSPMSLSSSLRERSRVSRQRRAIRQSGHHGQSPAVEGSALARQRRKMNVPKLYGCEEGEGAADAHSATSLESSLAGSGVFHRIRSSPSTSVSGSSLLDSEDALGRSTRRTLRLIKRLPKAPAVTDDEL